jgi:hypothetical protein
MSKRSIGSVFHIYIIRGGISMDLSTRQYCKEWNDIKESFKKYQRIINNTVWTKKWELCVQIDRKPVQEYVFHLNTLADLIKIRENTNENPRRKNKFIERL